MKRYIDAELLKKNIRVNLMPNVDIDGTVTVENAERYFLNLIDKTSAADVVEVKHGHWVKHSPDVATMRAFHKLGIGKGMSENSIFWTCSCCDSWGSLTQKYCNQCGAKMDGDKGRMTCKDCIHYEVCKDACENGYSDEDENGNYFTDACTLFKNKADFAEVIRCKDCKHRGEDECMFHINGEPADEKFLLKCDNDFCSYGERKDANGED